MSRHLAVLLALLLATLAVTGARGSEPAQAGWRLSERVPEPADGWEPVQPPPAVDALPADPRALETVRRSYAKAGYVVSVAIARYASRNDPDHRPLPDFIVAAPATVRVTPEAPLPLDPAGGTAASLLTLQRHDRRLTVAHWYQVAGEPIVGEYALRYRRFVDTLLGRPQPLVLVRLAGPDRTGLAEFVKSFYPKLRTIFVS